MVGDLAAKASNRCHPEPGDLHAATHTSNGEQRPNLPKWIFYPLHIHAIPACSLKGSVQFKIGQISPSIAMSWVIRYAV
jgi:hypothetical protein